MAKKRDKEGRFDVLHDVQQQERNDSKNKIATKSRCKTTSVCK